MTSGDPTAPKPTAAPRQARSSTGKKAAKPGKPGTAGSPGSANGGGSTRSGEPRVSVSKAGAGSLKRVSPTTDGGAADDVLERLARLGDAEPRNDEEAIELPPIVEADPTFPPLERPAEARTTEADTDGAAASTLGAGEDVLVLTAAAPASLAASTVVSADLPTAAVAAPTVDESPEASETTAIAPMTDPAALAPDRTDVAPIVPTVPTVPYEPSAPPVPFEVPEAAPSTDTSDGDRTDSVTLPLRRLKAPVVFRRARPRVRRVTRVVRHVDTWSVFKVALVFNVILYLCCLTSGVLLWNVAHATGTIDNVEKFFEQFGWESFEFKGGEIYHNAWIGGLFVAIGLTGFAVLVATLFNLITDLVGGIRVSVLEEEVVAKPRQGDPTGGTLRP